jgi:hypothetical protein
VLARFVPRGLVFIIGHGLASSPYFFTINHYVLTGPPTKAPQGGIHQASGAGTNVLLAAAEDDSDNDVEMLDGRCSPVSSHGAVFLLLATASHHHCINRICNCVLYILRVFPT